jgi:small subunit ribosomal protein S13
MARIQGIDLPKNKRGIIGLTYIYGIGSSYAKSILDEAKISHDKKIEDWSDNESNAIRAIIGDKYTVEGELRAETKMNIKRLMDVGCYRGIRHRMGLPLRGQKNQE